MDVRNQDDTALCQEAGACIPNRHHVCEAAPQTWENAGEGCVPERQLDACHDSQEFANSEHQAAEDGVVDASGERGLLQQRGGHTDADQQLLQGLSLIPPGQQLTDREDTDVGQLV